MKFDAQGGVLIDPGDPAGKVAARVSQHALSRWQERVGCGSAWRTARSLVEAMRAAELGQLDPKFCDARNALHGGQVAEYWLTDQMVLVVVPSVHAADAGVRVLATCYRRSGKYLTADEFARRYARQSGQAPNRMARRLGWRPKRRRGKR